MNSLKFSARGLTITITSRGQRGATEAARLLAQLKGMLPYPGRRQADHDLAKLRAERDRLLERNMQLSAELDELRTSFNEHFHGSFDITDEPKTYDVETNDSAPVEAITDGVLDDLEVIDLARRRRRSADRHQPSFERRLPVLRRGH